MDELKQENEALERENLALKYDLPDVIAVGLKGESRQEREAHAQRLRAYLNRAGASR